MNCVYSSLSAQTFYIHLSITINLCKVPRFFSYRHGQRRVPKHPESASMVYLLERIFKEGRGVRGYGVNSLVSEDIILRESLPYLGSPCRVLIHANLSGAGDEEFSRLHGSRTICGTFEVMQAAAS